jgi:hypothetical protein
MFPKKRGPYGNRHPFQSLNISFGVPSKGTLPPGPPYGDTSERERGPIPRDHLHSSFKVTGICAPTPDSRFPLDVKGPHWREIPVSGAFLNISSRVPNRGALSKGSAY